MANFTILGSGGFGMSLAVMLNRLGHTVTVWSAFSKELEDIKKYSMKAINHQKGSVDRDMMLGKNYETFTIPHHATGIHLTQKGMDFLENYVKEVRDVIGYEVPLAIDHFGHINLEDCILFARRLEKYNIAWIEDIAPWHYTSHYVKIANSCSVPICTGEDIYLAKNFEPLLSSSGVSVVHPDVLTVGGAMEMKKLGNLCDKYGTVSGFFHIQRRW